MQTVNLQYNVPAGYSLEEFVAKVNSYVARLTKKCQAGEEYEPNEETKAAIREAQAHIEHISEVKNGQRKTYLIMWMI